MKSTIFTVVTVCLFAVYLLLVFMLLDYASTKKSELKVEETHEETKPESQAETAEHPEETINESYVPVEEVITICELTADDFHTVCRMVEGEAEDQDYIGKALVAQCIMNACKKDGLNPSEVRTAYKYAGWNEDVTEDTKEAVYDVFYFGRLQTDKQILYFYDPRYCVGDWHETQKFALEYGCHRFFEEAS